MPFQCGRVVQQNDDARKESPMKEKGPLMTATELRERQLLVTQRHRWIDAERPLRRHQRRHRRDDCQ